MDFLKSKGIHEYSTSTIVNKLNYSRFEELNKYLHERQMATTMNEVAGMATMATGGIIGALTSNNKSSKRQIDSIFLDRVFRVFNEMCMDLYDILAHIFKQHSYECQSGSEILSRKERALNFLASSLDVK